MADDQNFFENKQHLITNVINTNKKLDNLCNNLFQNGKQLTINGKYHLFSLKDIPSKYESSPKKQFGFKNNEYEVYITFKPTYQKGAQKGTLNKKDPSINLHKYKPVAHGKLINDDSELKPIGMFKFISTDLPIDEYFEKFCNENLFTEVYNNKNSSDITIKNIFNVLHRYVPICFKELNTIYKHEAILNDISNINGISFETI